MTQELKANRSSGHLSKQGKWPVRSTTAELCWDGGLVLKPSKPPRFPTLCSAQTLGDKKSLHLSFRNCYEIRKPLRPSPTSSDAQRLVPPASGPSTLAQPSRLSQWHSTEATLGRSSEALL